MEFEQNLDVLSMLYSGDFDRVLQEAFAKDTVQVLNAENCKVFESICNAFAEVFQKPAKVEIHKHSCIASATVHMDKLHLDEHRINKLFKPISMCSTFAIDPCDDGGFDISATVNNVLIEI